VITWLMMPPLLYLSLGGNVRLDSSSGNTAFSAAFTSFASSSSSGFTNLMAGALLVVLLCICSTRTAALIRACFRNPATTGLIILAASSWFWAQFPGRTGLYATSMIANLLFAYFIVERFSPASRLRIFMLIGWLVIAASIVAAVAFPAYGLDHRGAADASGAWVGIFGHKNWCAIMVTFFLAAAFYFPAFRLAAKVERAIFIVLALFVIYQTQSRTGWVVTISLLLFIAAEKIVRSFPSDGRSAIVVMGIGLVLIGATLFWQYNNLLFSVLGKDSTLTGRTTIWQLAFQSIMKRPLLGYGYRAFWSGLQGESANVSLADHWIVPAAHNGYLDLWLELGGAGLGLFIIVTLRGVKTALGCVSQSAFARWSLCIITLTIVANISEGTIMVPNHLAWVFFLIASAGLQEEKRAASLEDINGHSSPGAASYLPPPVAA
jgi:exopolysaccharide production protein ExoQ